MQGGTRHTDRSVFWILDVGDSAGRARLLVRQPFGRRPDLRERDAQFDGDVFPLGCRSGPDQPGEPLVRAELELGIGEYPRQVRQARLAPLLPHSGRQQELLDEPRVRHLVDEPAVGASVGTQEWAREIVTPPHEVGQLQVEPDDLQHRLGQRNLQARPRAGPVAVHQRRHHSKCAEERRGVRRDRDACEQRPTGVRHVGMRPGLPVPVLVQPAIARRGAHHDALPRRYRCPGVVGGEARQRAVDHAGVRRGRVVRAEAEASHHPRAEVLHHYIRGADQVQADASVLVLSEVEGDALLSAVEEGVGQTGRLWPTRCVNVHHLGAVLGEQRREQGTRDIVAEVDDVYAIQRSGHQCASFARPVCRFGSGFLGRGGYQSPGTSSRGSFSGDPPHSARRTGMISSAKMCICSSTSLPVRPGVSNIGSTR